MSDGKRKNTGELFEDLVAVMARLRGEGGCPWDREQTHASLKRYALEETYELLEAIDEGDDGAMREELGDVLLQVVFHAQMASEDRRFAIDEVMTGLRDKLVRRHPHVFGDEQAADSDAVLRNWEKVKALEKQKPSGGAQGHSLFTSVPGPCRRWRAPSASATRPRAWVSTGRTWSPCGARSRKSWRS